MNDGLSARQVEEYKSNGFVFPIDVLSAHDAADHARRLAEIEANYGPMHYRVKPYLLCTSAYEIATNERLLDAVESVIGPNILLWDSGYIIKEPKTENFVSWHQDLTYWGLEMESDDDLLTAWVALTPVSVENGCMRFVNRSHRAGFFAHSDSDDENNILHRGQTITDEFPDEDITQIELGAGQMSFHHGRAVHSSNANITSARRIALALNFAKPSVRQTVGDGETATLVRGRDDFKNFGPEPTCTEDFASDNVAFQLAIEKRKREVYDNAT